MTTESKHTPGHISYLPCFTGDGYNYGGGLIVTFGDVSINLGGVDPQRGTYPNEKLAHLIAAAPELFIFADHPVIQWLLTDGLEHIPEPQRTSARIFLLPLRDAALAKATGATP
jgi:hypothetical protein